VTALEQIGRSQTAIRALVMAAFMTGVRPESVVHAIHRNGRLPAGSSHSTAAVIHGSLCQEHGEANRALVAGGVDTAGASGIQNRLRGAVAVFANASVATALGSNATMRINPELAVER